MTIDANYIQRQASDPTVSAWVSASAGSGKTKVLTDRVLNLMLLTGRPEKILCLTFTKVAAAEMQDRLTQILKKWAILSEESLTQELINLTGETPESETLVRARSLFAKVLEIPGGLKMMTIHSFCTSVLHRFPLEADVPPNFKVLDELSTNTLLNQALNQSLEDPSLVKYVSELARLMNQEDLLKLFNNILKDRTNLISLKEKYSSLSNLKKVLKKELTIPDIATEEDLISPNYSNEEWPNLVHKYLKVDGSIKKAHLDNPTALEVYTLFDKIKSLKLIKKNETLFHLIFAILEKYQHLKFKQNALDYDDLIDKMLYLLTTNHQASWVLYKLDGGIDHILVDEAQDTNPKQWKIIEALCDDFFAGETKSEVLRTLFVVGDKKQSIYSFQGARPDEFERRHQFFKEKIEQSENIFKTIPFNFSFRSTQPVLDLVNAVLKYDVAAKGILNPLEEAFHISKREEDSGLVEIWPLINPPHTDTLSPWEMPVKKTKSQSVLTQLCQNIARKISTLIKSQEILPSQNRPIQAGDFLILLQKRGSFMSELVRALKEADIPVAGVDRLELSQHIAVCDLMALVRFVLLPSDDLNLANLIKSPLLGLKEDDLFKLCVQRGTESVWERLQKLYPQTADMLKNLMNLADNTPVFEFFEYVLDTLEGRKKFIARLGNEVQEALDAFLDLTLQFEKENPPSLQGFLNWMNQQDVVIKRDMDQAQNNAVRIMTVHGSKGLQGNIVILPDTRGTKTIEKKRESLIWTHSGLPLWIVEKKQAPHSLDFLFKEMEKQSEEEKHRLLYVALTRASDRLYICGYNGKKKAQEENWYDLIINALGKETIDETLHFESKQIRIPKKKTIQSLPNDSDSLPNWVYQNSPKEIIKPILSPSKMLTFKEEQNTQVSETQLKALERGTLIHNLLQNLPSLSPQERKEKLESTLKKEPETQQKILNLIENSPIQDLFSENSGAEVPVLGTYHDQPISGQVDRLVVKEKEVLIIDFKTTKNIPKEIPKAYQMQLNVYKDLIKKVFPDKIVKTYLLWTENLTFTEVQ